MKPIFGGAVILLIVILCNEQAEGIKGLGKIKKQAKKFLKGIIKESKKETHSEEDYGDYPYAVPSPDGYGHVVYGLEDYGAYQPYDEGVDVYQIPKMWSGRLKIPNFLKGSGESYGDNRVVQGWDNRVGFRVAVPFLGDFQYLREIGPGKYTDRLGPGKFKYPGLNEKRQKQLADDYHHSEHSYHPPPPPSGYGAPVPQPGYGPPIHHEEVYYSGEEGIHPYSDPYAKKGTGVLEDEEEVETTEDPFASLRNYPWNVKRRR